jgi:hypothetical protein
LLERWRGGSGQGFADTEFNDEAAQSITSGVPLYRGSYRPEQTLSAFDGKNAMGTWTLSINDWLPIDDGWLRSWSLIFNSVGGLSLPPQGDEGLTDAPVPFRRQSSADSTSAIMTLSTAPFTVRTGEGALGELASQTRWMDPTPAPQEDRDAMPVSQTSTTPLWTTLSSGRSLVERGLDALFASEEDTSLFSRWQ